MATPTTQYPDFRDTPLRRFNTFWWGLAYFGLFGAVSALVYCMTSATPSGLAMAKQERDKVVNEVEKTQAAMMEGKKPMEMLDEVKMKPATTEVMVPGSEGAKKQIEEASAGGGEGQKIFLSKACATCHGADGKKPTAPIYPSLAGKTAEYLIEQMQDIKSGKRTTALTPAMKPFIDQCSDDDIKAMAEWLAE